MKKILVVVLSLALVSGVSAQKRFFVSPRVYYAPSVGIGLGYAPFWGYPYYGYPYGAYPYYGNGYRPSKLEMQIQDIKNDYGDKIFSVREDTNLSHKQRRLKVRELKQERDQKIEDLKMNYYKQ